MLHTPIHAPLGSGCQRPRPSTCHLIIAPLSSTPCKHASPVPPRLCPRSSLSPRALTAAGRNCGAAHAPH